MALSPTTILIVDDHQLIRETWAHILSNESHLKVVGKAANGEECIELVNTLNPDIILMDIDMKPINGIKATREVRKISNPIKVIGISMHSHPHYVNRMLEEGARGYITKNVSKPVLLEAIEEVSKGNRYLSPDVKVTLVEYVLTQEKNKKRISEREYEIVELICQGLTSFEISQKLQIKKTTVEVHRHNILRKLNLKNTAELVNQFYC
ncbi:response regulator transcription factor [Flavihumibacter sp. CACIAM 22H1]|uniref:response regulator n=1 Tax=Flavihumibacter sp. CACIAM 22H1 TaxID=1812911 RepID=UPI0007A810D1|nr:response regulator transcription factor [Flavihumibacter sp. CACIAM 22H1]KYP16612.1 MAG: hypothetical protein A1D16_09365 [Flavihumibacter sp. CACIAM 22H1]